MAKQSISGRVAQLARADIPALLERCTDPELLVDQLVADVTMTIAEAESAVAQTAASRRLLEQDRAEDLEAARAWGERASETEAEAVRRQAAGDTEAADRLEALSEWARDEHGWSEAQAVAADPVVTAFDDLGARLTEGLDSLRATLALLTTQRESLVATANAASAARRNGHRTFDLLDPAEALAHFDALVSDEAS